MPTATKTKLTPRLRYMAALKSYALKPTATGGKKLMDAGYAIGKTKVVVQADLKKAVKSSARRPNPDPISTFANLAGGLASALSVHNMLKGKPKAKKRRATKTATAATRRHANPTPVRNHGGRKILDRKVAKGGNLYMLTIGSGDDVESIYLHDGKGNGFSSRFKTLTGARSHAKRHGYKLIENPGRVLGVKRNSVDGFIGEDGVFHPIRSSAGYDDVAAGEYKPMAHKRISKAAKKRGIGAGTTKKKATAKKPVKRSATQPRLFNGSTRGVRLASAPGRRKLQTFASAAKFRVAYDRLSALGYCDSPGGAEYLRVLREWQAAKRPAVERFIVRRANIGPDGQEPSAARITEMLKRAKKNPLSIVSAAKRALARGKAKRELGRELRAKAKLTRIKARKEKAIAKATANPKPRAAKKKNPTPARIPRRRTFESFNGRQATNARQMNGSALAPQKLDQLGGLVELKLSSGRVLKFNPSRVALAAAGGKLWIAGAKILKANPAQRTNEIVPVLDARNNPEHVEHVVYTTHKPHHGDAPGTHYIHKLGEDTGHRPTLCVDRDGYPVLRGGQYKIEARGIVN